jgi:hypothetical protein
VESGKYDAFPTRQFLLTVQQNCVVGKSLHGLENYLRDQVFLG